MEINIYIANHGKTSGIEDIVEILKNTFVTRKRKVFVTKKLEVGMMNIIIDEFTNIATNYYILDFKKKNPSSKIILLKTEFIETKYLVTTYNFFFNIIDIAKVAFFSPIIKLNRSDYGSITYKDFLLFFLFFPIGFLDLLTFYFLSIFRKEKQNYLKANQSLIYSHFRYLGFLSMSHVFDGVILLHPEIGNTFQFDRNKIINFGTIYPEFNLTEIKKNLQKNKGLFFEITGSLTKYRYKWIKKINHHLWTHGMHNQFSHTKAYNFNDEKACRGAFSIHPPQTKNWKYSSPTRIFRALQNDFNIPVVTEFFGQHPIEEVAFKYEGVQTLIKLEYLFNETENRKKYINERLEKYNRLAKSNNDELFDKLENFFAKTQ
jgi:hypothetical protein